MPRLRVIGYVTAVTLLVGIPSAQAGSVDVTVSVSSPNLVTYRAAAGETNALNVNNGLIFSDSLAPLTAGAGCVSLGPNSADCSSAIGGGHGYTIDADLRDGNDSAHVGISGVANIHAGAGEDTVVADSFGGHTAVYGEGGDDEITAGGEGGQIADGGPGDDIVHAGGFAGQASGIGGPGNDIIYLQTFTAGGGATLDGGSGDDTIIARPDGLPSTASGGPGDDIIVIDGAPPQGDITGSYTVTGGGGNDTVNGGPFNDTIDVGAGRDFVNVRGGGADTVSCGAGVDVVLYDASDTIAGDCEITLLG